MPARPNKTTMPSTPDLRNKALQLLARREYARVELRQKLLPLTESPEELDALLDDLVERGWLSDARFTEQWVRYRSERYGPQRLKAELRQKGVADELIRETLSEAADDEEAQARALWLRKFGTPPAEQKERARQLRFLAGRGFSLSVIYKVVGGESNDDL